MLSKLACRHCFLPILSIPKRNSSRAHVIPLQAPVVDVVSFRKAPWYCQRRDATGLAEPVLCSPGVECVFLQVLFAFEGLEGICLDDEADETWG